jgi:pyruvate carboxylase subunit B
MPGMIIRYEVEPGAKVNMGDVILVLEAMKMENSITCDVSGCVKEIRCKGGDSVQKGDILAVIG